MNKDTLSRQPYLDLLKSIITNQKNNPTGYSFAIDGEWGAGKTWILQELEKQLLEEKDNKYLIFHYNAWENDFYDEPLVAILSVMIECLKKQKTKVKEKDSAKKVVTSSITALTKVAGTVIEKKWKINPNDIIEAVKDSGKAICDVKLTKSDFNNMLPLENALKQIKDVITKLSKELHIILVVDELDRCLPEYAIKVLERLHHICNEMPIIQILAYSGKALANSIARIYGGDLITDKLNREAFSAHYLEKFIKLTLPLNFGCVDKSLSSMFEGLEKKYRPVFEESENFLKLFHEVCLGRLPIRNRKQILETVNMIHEIAFVTNKFTNFISTYELLCCEILIVMDRVLMHAQDQFSINYVENENTLHLNFSGDASKRFSEVLKSKDFFKILNNIRVDCSKIQTGLPNYFKYHVRANNSISIVFLTFADCERIVVDGSYCELIGKDSVKVIQQNKDFIEKFYFVLYQFFSSSLAL